MITFFGMPRTASTYITSNIIGDVNHIGHETPKNKLNLIEKYRNDSFCFVRNPYYRLISAYNWIRSGGNGNVEDFYSKEQILKYKDFDDFVLNGGLDKFSNPYNEKTFHFYPQSYWIYDCGKCLINHVGKYENLKEDYKDICEKTGMVFNWSNELKYRTSVNHQFYDEYYKNEEVINKVFEVYKEDFEKFSYSKIPYFKLKDNIFIIGTWTNTKEKEEILVKCIKKVKQFGADILLVSHYPVASYIQNMVDYYLYDKNNEVLEKKDYSKYSIGSKLWLNRKDFKIEIKYPYHHDYAIWCSWRNAFNFAKFLNKKRICYLEYDCVIDDVYKFSEQFLNKKDVPVLYEYEKDSHKNGYVSTFVFSLQVDDGLKIVESIKSKKDYFTNKPKGYQLERVFFNYLNKIRNDYYITEYNQENFNIFSVFSFGENKSKFNIYPVVNQNNDNLYILINPKNKILLNIIYNDFNKFIELDSEKLVNLGKFKINDKLKILHESRVVYEYIITEDVYDNNKIIFNNDEKVKEFDYSINFIDKAKIDIKPKNHNKKYLVEFIDNGNTIHSSILKGNMWSATGRRWFTDWSIKVTDILNKEVILNEKYDAVGKNVYIHLDSKSIGDTISWFPYVEEFRKKWMCRVFVSTFHNNFFEKNYPDLIFINPGDVVPNLYAMYQIGCWHGDLNRNKNHWENTPLQKISSDILGLDYKEIRPNFVKPKIDEFDDNIITLSEHSTAMCKYWNYENGWQDLVNKINDMGYKVKVVSKESTNLKNIINNTDRKLEETINNIYKSKIFIGVSSGLAWIAWALGKPVVMISGCTQDWNEPSDVYRVINKNVCHGCMNNSKYEFDKGSWYWCPENKNFECTRSITPDMVIDKIKEALNES